MFSYKKGITGNNPEEISPWQSDTALLCDFFALSLEKKGL